MNSRSTSCPGNASTPARLRSCLGSGLACCLLVLAPATAHAQLGNVWHVPAETRPSGVYPAGMRDPLVPGPNTSVTLHQGVYKANGGNNQTGGTLHYRVGGGPWQSSPLVWHANEAGNANGFVQIWKSSITPPASAGTRVDYYFATTFSAPYTSPTYLHDRGGTATTADPATAAASPFSFLVADPLAPASFTVATPATGTLAADYTTTKLHLDETTGETVPITIAFAPGVAADEVELWTNLNQRDRAGADADGDGIHDGIVPPPAPATRPPGQSAGPYPSNGYFQAIPLTGSGGIYRTTLAAGKTGAYRLTARYRIAGQSNWTWFTGRDHCITVSPRLARDLQVYEINVFNVNATSDSFAGRSTFESLMDPGNGRVNLAALRALGVNTLWFQPVHPSGIEGREPSGGWGSSTPPYDPGSPYAVRNFFEINERMTSTYQGSLPNPAQRAASMAAFSSFVAAADAQGVHVMLDAPFNHTAHDCEVSNEGLALFSEAGIDSTGWSPTDPIRQREARFYSSAGAAGVKYAVPANSAADVATAPDRNDFGKWHDVKDVFFGRYATLVTGDPDAATSSAIVLNESDTLRLEDLRGGPGSNGAITRAVWKYFARYVPYWLERTGLPAGSPKATQARTGIDGLRADFGQGMPPQFWEYCINVARAHKWSFVFMTESLDGGAVTYRSNRHFDILNENIVFPWQAATTASAHRAILEERRTAYGQGLVLLNNSSHDEVGYADPWQAFIRHAVGSTVDGAPMILYGQEIGSSDRLSFQRYEVNFGKSIPHFKAWNSLQPQWISYGNNAYGVRHLFPAYAGTGQAREGSPALRASGRWFLNPLGSQTPDESIHAVAKYEEAKASPATKDVVLAFVNLDRERGVTNTFGIPAALGTLLGIQPGRSYNVRNLAAYTGIDSRFPERRSQFLWGSTGRRGSELLAQGVTVSLAAVPTRDSDWATAPYEPLYLKLHDVTPPPPPAGAPSLVTEWSVPGATTAFTVDGSASASWAPVSDPEGLVPVYRVTLLRGDGSLAWTRDTAATTLPITGLVPGDRYTVKVAALNPSDLRQASANSATSAPIAALEPDADPDGDGQGNAAELVAGTDPLDPSARFGITSIARSGSRDVTVTWNAVAGRTYRLEATHDPSAGGWTPVANGLAQGSATERAVSSSARFYRVVVE